MIYISRRLRATHAKCNEIMDQCPRLRICIEQRPLAGQCIPPLKHVLLVLRYGSAIRIATIKCNNFFIGLLPLQPSLKISRKPFAQTDKQTDNDDYIFSLAEVIYYLRTEKVDGSPRKLRQGKWIYTYIYAVLQKNRFCMRSETKTCHCLFPDKCSPIFKILSLYMTLRSIL